MFPGVYCIHVQRAVRILNILLLFFLPRTWLQSALTGEELHWRKLEGVAAGCRRQVGVQLPIN